MCLLFVFEDSKSKDPEKEKPIVPYLHLDAAKTDQTGSFLGEAAEANHPSIEGPF